MMLKNSKSLLTISIIVYFTADWFVTVLGILPSLYNWIKFFVIFLLFVRTVLLSRKIEFRIVDFIFFLLIIESLISMALNERSYIVSLLGLKDMVIPILIFYIIRYERYNRDYYRYLFNLFIIIGLIQFAVVLFQYGSGIEVDQISGTMGRSSTGNLAIFMVSLISLSYALFQITKKSKYLIYMLCFTLVPILNSTRIFLLLLFVPLFFILITSKVRFRRRHKLMLVVGSILVMTFIVEFNKRVYDQDIIEIFTEKLEKNLTLQTKIIQNRGIGRISSLIYVFASFQNQEDLIFGHGPAALKSTYLGQETGIKKFKRFNPFSGSPSGFSMTLYQWGLSGTILYLLMSLIIVKYNYNYYKRAKLLSDKYLAVAFFSTTTLFIVGELYTSLWFRSNSVLFWIIGGIVYWEQKRNLIKRTT